MCVHASVSEIIPTTSRLAVTVNSPFISITEQLYSPQSSNLTGSKDRTLVYVKAPSPRAADVGPVVTG